jgi:hypothetical protein
LHVVSFLRWAELYRQLRRAPGLRHSAVLFKGSKTDNRSNAFVPLTRKGTPVNFRYLWKCGKNVH